MQEINYYNRPINYNIDPSVEFSIKPYYQPGLEEKNQCYARGFSTCHLVCTKGSDLLQGILPHQIKVFIGDTVGNNIRILGSEITFDVELECGEAELTVQINNVFYQVIEKLYIVEGLKNAFPRPDTFAISPQSPKYIHRLNMTYPNMNDPIYFHMNAMLTGETVKVFLGDQEYPCTLINGCRFFSCSIPFPRTESGYPLYTRADITVKVDETYYDCNQHLFTSEAIYFYKEEV